MNVVFVPKVIDVMGMPREANLFWVWSQAKELGRRRGLLHASIQLLRQRVCLTVAAMLRVSMRGLKPTYVRGFLIQT